MAVSSTMGICPLSYRFTVIEMSDLNRMLRDAARRGNMLEVRGLVGDGADVRCSSPLGTTPLHWAAETGQYDAVEYLISVGADVMAEDKHGQTPLDRAITANQANVIDLLQKAADSAIGEGMANSCL